MVGTLRANRRGNPRDVISKKLKKGELFAQQSSSNIVVMKWRDKRDIYLITTKHTDETIEIRRKTGDIIKKPLAVEDYNIGKSFIDRSDQMASYSSPLKRSIKWYRKVAFDILLSTSVVNALSLYKSVNMNNITITRFKEEIIKPLLFKPTVPSLPGTPISHKLVSCGNLKKRMCQKCYSRLSSEFGRKVAQNRTRKILTRCEGCNIFICRDCFIKFHKSSL
uniref:PiggyBac transposable element-derived protein 4 n=1 Tax=Sipha flava TaxID=143950 RepID=A0A2S2QM41_9HEMI